ncbi:MAG TPA: DNA polymerase III subunit delta [Acholeplasmataceae bacterium]|jgi:DNA polymerase-3 subunit delta|nr:DNA polymerase III subunit delta [Acholeplasmataceae bacterium]
MDSLIYLYHGASEYLLRKEINKLLAKLKVDEHNVVKYDLMESEFVDVIEELQTISFFRGQKVVLLSSILELYDLNQYDQDRFISYLEKPNPDTILIMYSSKIKEDESEMSKALNLYAKIIKMQDIDKKELPNLIRKNFNDDDYQINGSAITELIERTNGDFQAIEQEITKLKLYAYDQKFIDVKAIRLLVSKNLDENMYELLSAILNKEKTKAIQIYYDLLVTNVQPVQIIGYISNRVRDLIHTSLLVSRNYTTDMIAKHFKISDGRAYYMVRDAKRLNINELESYLQQLSDLDFDIKSGNIDPRLGVELFLFGV